MVELLVVIAIIGVLATLLLLQLGTARSKARDARRIADISQLRVASELYSDDNARYPVGCTVVAAGSCPSIVNTPYPMGVVANSIQPYIASTNLPKDPTTGADYAYTWNVAVPSKFQVWGELELNNTNAFRIDADINTAAAAGTWGAVGLGTNVDGTLQACTAAANDCVFDLGTP